MFESSPVCVFWAQDGPNGPDQGSDRVRGGRGDPQRPWGDSWAHRRSH